MRVPRLKTCETYASACSREAVWRVRVPGEDITPRTPSEDASWAYDAPQHHPLTAHRIPITSAYPEYRYLVAFDRESAQLPTAWELRMLVCYLDKVRSYFNDTWRARLLSRPFDTDSGQNTLIFHKRGPGNWAYRRWTWRGGPEFAPMAMHPLTLPELLDHVHGHRSDDPNIMWMRWRGAHAEVFTPDTDTEPITVPDPERTAGWWYACTRHLNQVSTYVLDGERGHLDLEHLVCDEGSRDTLKRYREDA